MSVEVRSETIDIPTYVWGPPDPNPPFQREANWSIYPYPLLDDIREEARPVGYRSLVVENEFLRVTVLPELGGRIYSAVHKPSGRELFYRNNVVKPGLIGLRGAWISGGVEWNFPRGHTVTTVSQVDARAVNEEDGSAAIWVGNVEQIHRMGWAVGIRLRPATARIETEVVLSNRTALPHPYYFWANAAVPAREDMRLIYPAGTAHTWRRPRMDWPIHEGKDMARYTAFPSANDVFLLDSLEDFFGVYYDGLDFGLAHIADVHHAFGKKFFTWGTADHGKVWSAALSDDDGPYCEIQSGRFVDQTTWRHMPPHHGERWREWWFPLSGMGGFAWANRDAAVRLWRDGGSIEAGIAVARPYAGAGLRLMDGERVAHRRQVDLSPERSLRVEFRGEDMGARGPLTLILEESSGDEVIRFTENQRPRTVTLRDRPEEGEASTAGDLVRSALRAEERSDFPRAMELYEKALELDPACAPALIALGRLAIERSPQRAVDVLRRAADATPESAEAAYHLGMALVRAGREAEAEVELWRAAHRPQFAHAAHFELGLLAMRREEWSRAAELLHASLTYRRDDTRAHCMLAAALRRSGRLAEACAEVEAVTVDEPLDRLAWAEAHFCASDSGHPRIAARHLRSLREMLPPESDPWLELALDYTGAGLCREAADLLTWGARQIAAVRGCPLVHHLLAHCLRGLGRGEEVGAERSRARKLPSEGVFAHHWELEAVLREALEEDPQDDAARYYLGCLLYGRGRREDALREWESAAERSWDLSVLYRNLALGYRQAREDTGRAEQALRRALAANPRDVRLYLELSDVLKARGASTQERLAALDAAPPGVRTRGSIAAQQVACCIDLEEWDRAISLLTTHTFHRWEMEFRMRSLYMEACLGRGIARYEDGNLGGAREDFERALGYPMNIRVGRPAEPRDARAHWCAAVVCEALGEAAAAAAHWESAAAESHHPPGSELAIYRALSLRKVGRADEGDAALVESVDRARAAAEADPEDAENQFSLGLALRAAGRDDEAGDALARALALDPAMKRARRLADGKALL